MAAPERGGESVASALADLEKVRAPGAGGVFASAGDLFRDAFFSRDAEEVAEDLIETRPDISADVIRGITVELGTHDAPIGLMSTEEERGKAHHESRRLVINGRRITPESQRLLEDLARRWGGTPERMTYYGSVDGSPLFVRLVAAHVAHHGRDILEEVITNKDGEQITVAQAVVRATEWIDRRIAASSVGLLEFQRRNPDGAEYQDWRDGKVSAIHPNGAPADFRQPIAMTEVQGVAYDALLAAADLFGDHPEAETWRGRAESLRQATLQRLWLPDQGYFAMGLDRDPSGRPRPIRTIATNGAELLDTRLFDGLPDADRKLYVGGIVRTIMGADFVTGAGVRATSLRHKDIVNYWQYQGVFTSWFKETYDVAKGMRRQGFGELAEQLENRITNTVGAIGNSWEFVYVDERGRAVLDPTNSRGNARPRVAAATNLPDNTQAWTASAVLAIKLRRGQRRHNEVPTEQWARDLQRQILRRIPLVAAVTDREALRRAFASSPAIAVDRELGRAREAAFVLRQRAGMAPLTADGGGLSLAG